MSKPATFASPEDVEQAFYEAVAKGDADLLMLLWAEDEETLCVHPTGVRLLGIAPIRESWRGIFANAKLRVEATSPTSSSSATTPAPKARPKSPTALRAARTAGAWSAATPRPPTTATRRWPTPSRTRCTDMPSPPYRAPAWLPGGHAQTIWPLLIKSQPPRLRRERWTTPDGDFIDADFVDGPPDAPLLVMFHGLEGSARSHYTATTAHACKAARWRFVTPHFARRAKSPASPTSRSAGFHFGLTVIECDARLMRAPISMSSSSGWWHPMPVK